MKYELWLQTGNLVVRVTINKERFNQANGLVRFGQDRLFTLVRSEFTQEVCALLYRQTDVTEVRATDSIETVPLESLPVM